MQIYEQTSKTPFSHQGVYTTVVQQHWLGAVALHIEITIGSQRNPTATVIIKINLDDKTILLSYIPYSILLKDSDESFKFAMNPALLWGALTCCSERGTAFDVSCALNYWVKCNSLWTFYLDWIWLTELLWATHFLKRNPFSTPTFIHPNISLCSL